MPEFRLTRIEIYSDPNCPGHNDVSARQGHYIPAESEEEARAQMIEWFPNETFTCNEFESVGNVTIRPMREGEMEEMIASIEEDRAIAACERAIHIGEHGGELNE
jgi:hypothetical protein